VGRASFFALLGAIRDLRHSHSHSHSVEWGCKAQRQKTFFDPSYDLFTGIILKHIKLLIGLGEGSAGVKST
jgi:hypothetical protein